MAAVCNHTGIQSFHSFATVRLRPSCLLLHLVKIYSDSVIKPVYAIVVRKDRQNSSYLSWFSSAYNLIKMCPEAKFNID